MKFWPAFEVVRKAFDGIPLDRTSKFDIIVNWKTTKKRSFTEETYLRYLYDQGRCNIKSVEKGKKFRELVLCAGRRSGKSIFATWITADVFFRLCLDPPHARWNLAPRTPVSLLFCSIDKDQMVLGMDEVRRFVVQTDPRVGSDFTAASIKDARTGVVIYGRSSYSNKPLDISPLAFTVLEDFAHGNDFKGIYEAIKPLGVAHTPKDPNDLKRCIGPSESRIVSCFSPSIMEKGKDFAFTLFQSGFRPDNNDTLCVRIPAWEANPTLPHEWFAKHAERDPIMFKVEHGTEFVDKDGNSWKSLSN